MGIKHPFTSSKSDGANSTKVRPSAWNTDHVIDGDVDVSGHAVTNVADEAYNQTAWDGNLSVPTKNAIRDKIEALVLTGGGVTDFLALDDTPDTYTNASAGRGPWLGVNAAENAVDFKYSTEQYIDIRDYGTVTPTSDITAAWRAAMLDSATHRCNCIRIPHTGPGLQRVTDYSIDPTLIPGLDGTYAGAWTFEFDGCNIRPSSTIRCAGDQVWRGIDCGVGLTQQLSGAFPASGFENHEIGAGPFANGYTGNLFDTNGAVNVTFENLGFRSNSGAAFYVNGGQLIDFHRCAFSTNDTNPGTGPCVILNSCFWINMYDIWIQPNILGDPAILFMTDTTSGHFTLNCALIRIKELRTTRAGVRFQAGGPLQDPLAGAVNNIIIENFIAEGVIGGRALLEFDSRVQAVGAIEVYQPGIADAVSGTVYYMRNTSTAFKRTSGINIYGSGLPVQDGVASSQLFDPASTHPIDNLTLIDNSNDNYTAGSPAQMSRLQSPSPSNASWSRWWRNAIDAKILTAPIPGVNWNYGTPLLCENDPANWVEYFGGSGMTKTTGLRAPDGSLMAAKVDRSCLVLRQNMTLALGDWFIAGIWCKSDAGGNTNCGSTIANDGAFPNYHFWEWNGEANPASYYSLAADSDFAIADGWRWQCAARKITRVGDLNPIDVIFTINNDSRSDMVFFAPAAMRIPASAVEDDAWPIRMARMLRGGWSASAPAGAVSCLDHQEFYALAGIHTKKIVAPKSPLLTIASGVVTATGSYHRIDTEAAAASDDLDTINGGVDGYRLILVANNVARTTVLKDGTGNLVLAGGVDFSLDNTEDTIELVYDIGLAKWLELSRSDNGA